MNAITSQSSAATPGAGPTGPIRLRHQLAAEALGTAALLCAVIGSGIMAERLSAGNMGMALLSNTLATVFALFVLITLLSPVSGAHFNPLVTLVVFVRSRWSASRASAAFRPQAQQIRALTATYFIASQLVGAVAGALLAHAMFDLPLLQTSSHVRSGWGQYLGEAVATAGLLLVVLRAPAAQAPALVACFIGAAYWFTSSTSFANPAAVLGRMLSDSFAGIAPSSAPGFVLAEVVGAAMGALLHRLLGPQPAGAA
jgi:glycerol uptake facilitator-like aquaporin